MCTCAVLHEAATVQIGAISHRADLCVLVELQIRAPSILCGPVPMLLPCSAGLHGSAALQILADAYGSDSVRNHVDKGAVDTSLDLAKAQLLVAMETFHITAHCINLELYSLLHSMFIHGVANPAIKAEISLLSHFMQHRLSSAHQAKLICL